MRIDCPLCGTRDSREFHYRGAAKLCNRPAPEAGEDAFFDYVFIRDNPSGENRELWHHEMGCRAWLLVTRNVTSHEILSVSLAADSDRGQV